MINREGEVTVASRKTVLRELDQLYSDEEIAWRGKDLRPWFARPGVWTGAICAGGCVLFLMALFLRVAH